MRKKNKNLSGQWSGEFAYPAHAGPVTTMEDHGGQLSGTIIEPDIVTGAATAEAVFTGIRHGSTVDFTKSYGPRASYGYENPVDYVGSISADGNTISGVWSLLEFDGTFEMRREAAEYEVEQEEVTVALPVPVAP